MLWRDHIRRVIELKPFRPSNLSWLRTYVHLTLRGCSPAWEIFTHMTLKERLLLYRLGLKQPPGARFLEVGSYLGASACFLAAAAREIGGGARVHCVDTWQNEGMSEGLRDTWAEFSHNVAPFAQQLTAHRRLSLEVAAEFAEKLDLLFIDGDHGYESCRTDVLAWLPHLRAGGTVVMHDYGWAEGVKRVVAEILQPRQQGPGQVLDNTYYCLI